jgi:hypothetical protein
MRDEVRPLVAEHWAEGTFPRQLVARFRESGLVGLPYEGYGEPGPAVSQLLTGTMAMEMCRDGSRPGQRGGCGRVRIPRSSRRQEVQFERPLPWLVWPVHPRLPFR